MANTLELFPDEPKQRISPLAQAAADAALDSTGCLTEYRPLQVQSIIGKASRTGLDFTHSINPYRGCEFACRYCYARFTHEFLELHDPAEFERKIYFKQNAAWLVRQELAKLKAGTHIALGTATDPYQPLERKQRITRSILKGFAATSGLNLGIVTKSTLIARDVDLLKEIASRHALTIAFTVTTMDTKLARLLEPRAPRPDLRMRNLARIREAGVRAGVLCSPLMPGITDSRSNIDAVARAAAAAGARFLGAGALFLKSCSQETFFQFVQEHFPEQLANYQRRYAGGAYVAPDYRKRISELVATICREHKLGRHFEDMPFATESQAQKDGLVSIQPWLPFVGMGRRS